MSGRVADLARPVLDRPLRLSRIDSFEFGTRVTLRDVAEIVSSGKLRQLVAFGTADEMGRGPENPAAPTAANHWPALLSHAWGRGVCRMTFRPGRGCAPHSWRSGPRITGAREGFPGHVWWLAEDLQGVQWNAWIDDDTDATYLGVNLEGLRYIDWPIARLIERELADPAVFAATAALRDPVGIEVVWRRDVWRARQRLEVRELYVAPTPIPISRLTPPGWKEALLGARGCLNAARGYRGRATGTFTLLSGERELREVSPHLQFRKALRGPFHNEDALGAALQAAREQLEPLHQFVQMRIS